jgi:stage II sporulation protein GA (sporulation sigma-E factor processing peptidase)
MCLAAFSGEKRFFRVTLTFFIVSAAFGGAVFAASMLSGKRPANAVYMNVSMRVLILSFAVAYAVLTLVFRRFGKRTERSVHTVAARYGGREAVFRALYDTGNELHDPVSGSDVLIVERGCALGLFDDDTRRVLSDSSLSPVEMLMRLGPGLRLIPYSAVGVERSLLLAFRPDGLMIDGKERKDVIIALSPTKICESGEYSAVL